MTTTRSSNIRNNDRRMTWHAPPTQTDETIELLQEELKRLRSTVDDLASTCSRQSFASTSSSGGGDPYHYASHHATYCSYEDNLDDNEDYDDDDDDDVGGDDVVDTIPTFITSSGSHVPDSGMPASHVREMIEQIHTCNFNPRLNTASYVNVVSEEEERQVAMLGATINLADASVYPASIEIHEAVVAMLAKMWHAPIPKGNERYAGTGTVGSTEACMLGGLALKHRWRNWYARTFQLSTQQVNAIRPNIVISSAYQAAWEKFCKHFDVDAKVVKPTLVQDKMMVSAKQMIEQCDEKTIAVVGILGNHYNGSYDPIWEIDAEVEKFNKAKRYQIGIHVDAASGGFIAPFQEDMKPFDFRLRNVLSFSASGHKFGESAIGTGWLIFRQREDLAEHVAVSVSYLGGSCDSITLNFSRPASGCYVQYYKMLRLGREGYQQKVDNQLLVASYLRKAIKRMKHRPSGKPRFQILDDGCNNALPVIAARLNPELGLTYNDIDLQHALAESHWYVGGYKLGFENLATEQHESIFADVDGDTTMFRIVCKSNLTVQLAQRLRRALMEALKTLDERERRIHQIVQSRTTATTLKATESTVKRCSSMPNGVPISAATSIFSSNFGDSEMSDDQLSFGAFSEDEEEWLPSERPINSDNDVRKPPLAFIDKALELVKPPELSNDILGSRSQDDENIMSEFVVEIPKHHAATTGITSIETDLKQEETLYHDQQQQQSQIPNMLLIACAVGVGIIAGQMDFSSYISQACSNLLFCG